MLEGLFDNFYYNNLLYVVMIILIAVAIINDKRKKDKVLLNQKIDKHIDGIFLLKISSLSFAIRILLEQIISLLPIDFTKVASMDSLSKVIVQVIVACLIAPIFEEIIFRFGLFDYLNKKFNVVVSIVVTSVIFALIHNYNIDGFILVFSTSVFYTYSYNKTNNLIYPIILHGFHNIYALISYVKFDNICYIIFGIINLILYVLLKLKSSNKNVAVK